MKIDGTMKVCSFCGLPKFLNTVLRKVINRNGIEVDLYLCDDCIKDI